MADEERKAAQRNPAESARRRDGSYGQRDFSQAACRSQAREGDRYADTGWAVTEVHHSEADDAAGGGSGGHSGYGSSGQGQFGAGGFAQGGYGRTGYGRNYGQDTSEGGEYGRRSARPPEKAKPDEKA